MSLETLAALFYFDEMQNVNVNKRMQANAQNNEVQDLHHVLHFVKVKQHTHLN